MDEEKSNWKVAAPLWAISILLFYIAVMLTDITDDISGIKSDTRWMTANMDVTGEKVEYIYNILEDANILD